MSPTAATPAAFTALDQTYEIRDIATFVESALNPRKTFSAGKLDELAASVAEKGVIEPLVARPHPKKPDLVEIICGARRFRAAKQAGLDHLAVIIRRYTDTQAIEIMAIENGQRDDVPPLEEAAGYKQLLLVDKTYTASMIAAKIGRPERYVWDRLRLLELVAEIQELLKAGEIGVEHAEVIAKLKPAEQKSLLKTRAYSGESGLFEPDNALAFDEDPARKVRRKPVSVRELKQHIAEHVRLDLKHAAAAAPLEFGETKQRVDVALAQPGRGKKVIPITLSHYCPDGAKDSSERTYGATAWKKAENKDGEATCDHAVLGLVVAGEQYGQSFKVCIARDRCKTHWAEVVRAKEKAQKLRDSGKPKQAAKVEKNSAEREQDRWKREAAEREAERKAWKLLEPHIYADAVVQVKGIKALTAAHAKALLELDYSLDARALKEHLGASWFKTPVTALLVTAAVASYYGTGFDEYVKRIAKPLSLNIKRLEAVRDKHQPKAPAAAPAKKAS